MKRSRMITCCGKQTHSESSDCINQRPRPQPASSGQHRGAENRGAHNKYAAGADSHHHHHLHHSLPHTSDAAAAKAKRSTTDGVCDVGDLTVTLPGMVVGGGSKSNSVSTAGATGASRSASSQTSASVTGSTSDKMHISGSDKVISRKDKARQKFHSSILKRAAKVLITDRASQSTSPYKVNSTPALSQDKFKVLKIKAAIDKKPTSIDERSTAVLKYRTPHFRAVASVEVPCLREHQGVQIGWIQACTEMRFVNSYGKHGMTSWEFPEIVSGKYTMIGDADGKQYPWYGSKLELQSVTGPTSSPTVTTIHMNDNFFPQVTWYIPHPEHDKTPRLTHIHRKQKFYTFLVAKDVQSGQYHVLKTIEWWMELNIAVSPGSPLGKRATLCEPLEQAQPRILEFNSIKLQPYALAPPNANNAQTLIWRPRDAEPRMIVPPVETSMDMERYLHSTRALHLHLPPPHAASGSASPAHASAASTHARVAATQQQPQHITAVLGANGSVVTTAAHRASPLATTGSTSSSGAHAHGTAESSSQLV